MNAKTSTTLVLNEEEALQKLRTLLSEGWGQPLPYDSPERATRGLCLFRYLDTETRRVVKHEPSKELGDLLEAGAIEEEMLCLVWPVFDKPLDPDDKTVEPESLVEFLQQHEEVASCDDPRRLLIGFAAYDPEAGAAHIRRVRLTKLKRRKSSGDGYSSKIDRDNAFVDAIMRRREALVPNQRYEQRAREVAEMEEAARSA